MANQASTSNLSRTISIVLGIIILGTIAVFIYILSVPAPDNSFTEFYILGPGGAAIDYPVQLEVGEEGKLIVGIVNYEQKAISYRVAIRADGVDIGGAEPILLGPRGKSERSVSFTMNRPGETQKVDFLLYKDEQIEASESLHLWVDVTE